MGADRLDDLLADSHRRVERARRVLEDHRDVGSAVPAHLRLGQTDELLAEEADGARHLGARRQQADDGPRADRLARARLADDGERPSRLGRVAEPVHGGDVLAPLAEVDMEVGDLEQRRRRPAPGHRRGRGAGTGAGRGGPCHRRAVGDGRAFSRAHRVAPRARSASPSTLMAMTVVHKKALGMSTRSGWERHRSGSRGRSCCPSSARVRGRRGRGS